MLRAAPKGSGPGTAPAPSPTATQGKTAQAPVVPFMRAALPKLVQAFDTGNVALASSRVFVNEDIPPDGFLRAVWLLVTITAANPGGPGANVAFNADGPFNVLQDLVFADQNGSEVVGPESGYDVMLQNKYGGYEFYGDPRSDPNYSKITGTGGTGGSASFAIRIPLEIASRDAFCALPNMDSSSLYQLRFSLAALAELYNVLPAGAVTCRVQAFNELWSGVQAQNAGGIAQQQTPNGQGSTSYWSKQSIPIGSGDQTIVSKRVGNIIRGIIIICRDSSNLRVDDFPATGPLTFNLDNQPLYRWLRARQLSEIKERYGYSGAADAAGGSDTGVYVLSDWMSQLSHPNNELRDLYRPTLTSTRITFEGSFASGADKVDILTNDLKVTSGASLYS